MSNDPRVVSRQIDEILTLSRNETERQIAGYRLFVFAAAMVLGFGVPWFTEHRSFVAGPYWAVCLGYGLLYREALRRYGARPALVGAGLVVDLAAVAGMFLVTDHFADPGIDRGTQTRWPLYVLPATLYVFLLLNALRSSRAAAVVGAVWSATLFTFVTVWFDGWQVQQVVTVAIFLSTGWIGFLAAQQSRRVLDRFARFQLLRRYLPTAAVNRVLTENPDDALALGGDLLTVTILAADLRNFTGMSERLAPAEVVRQLNAYHGSMLEVIERHGGMLDKFIGDGTLVVFGLERALPIKQKDSGAAAACLCARQMLVALEKLNRDRVAHDLPALKMGIGIHTGPVVAGNIGAPGRRIEFTVVGDTVNTAARLEGLTKECGHSVVLSAATANLLETRDDLLSLEPVRLRGKDQPVPVFGMDAPATVAAPPRVMPRA